MDLEKQKELVEEIIKNDYDCERSFLARKHCWECLFGTGYSFCPVAEKKHKKLICDKFLELVKSEVLTDELFKSYYEDSGQSIK